MKIVRFLGGLGNQMFQYAFYKALQKRHDHVKADLTAFYNYELHNGFELEEVFDIKLNKASPFYVRLYDNTDRAWLFRKLRRLTNLKSAYMEEKRLFSFDEKILTDPKDKLYFGYWQNEKYFADVSNQVRKCFEFKKPLNEKNQQVLDVITKTNSIAIHVRRGDYLHDPLLGGLCDINYYHKAISYVSEKIASPEFFIFSDDIPWCQSMLQLPDPCYISGNSGNSSYVDMQLMSNCKHHIIANSSFSWWAAWLSTHQAQIVIAPKVWTNDPSLQNYDITLDKWIKI